MCIIGWLAWPTSHSVNGQAFEQMRTLTIRESITIDAVPEVVWDFTQDYQQRTRWDKSIKAAAVIRNQSPRVVLIRASGGLSATLTYKLDDRPKKTTLSLTDVRSRVISGGGGSWQYVQQGDHTLWTQTNTLILKRGLMMWAAGPFIGWILKRNTRRAMQQAKHIIESQRLVDAHQL